MSNILEVKVLYDGFEEPVLGFEEPVLGFAAFDRFEEPVLGFEKLKNLGRTNTTISVRQTKHNLRTDIGNLEITFRPDDIPSGSASGVTGRLTVTKPDRNYFIKVRPN